MINSGSTHPSIFPTFKIQDEVSKKEHKNLEQANNFFGVVVFVILVTWKKMIADKKVPLRDVLLRFDRAMNVTLGLLFDLFWLFFAVCVLECGIFVGIRCLSRAM